MSPSIVDEGDNGDAHPSTFPCINFLSDAGILDDFLLLVNRVGLTIYMLDESDQYAMLKKIFVEIFTFTNSAFKPPIAFKIYDRSVTMSLERVCSILGIAMFGTAKKIQGRPADLLELYREVTNDDNRTTQRGKIRNIQLPAIRYFAYYLATSILGRENTSNISNYHLAFLAIVLNGCKKYNLGALIARRLATRGHIYEGIIAAHIVAALGLSVAPNDILLAPQRLDLAAIKVHHFVTANSCAGSLVYRMLFIDGDERAVPLPQPSLFSICRGPRSRSKAELDEQLRLLGSIWSRAPRARRRRRPLIITLCIIPGHPRAHIRTKVLLRHILEMPLHGHVGIDLHLGQTPKLGGRYTDISLIYTSYSVGTLYIHISLSFFFFVVLVLFLLSKIQKDQKYFCYFSLFLSLVF
jgi:hypothetical protein